MTLLINRFILYQNFTLFIILNNILLRWCLTTTTNERSRLPIIGIPTAYTTNLNKSKAIVFIPDTKVPFT